MPAITFSIAPLGHVQSNGDAAPAFPEVLAKRLLASMEDKDRVDQIAEMQPEFFKQVIETVCKATPTREQDMPGEVSAYKKSANLAWNYSQKVRNIIKKVPEDNRSSFCEELVVAIEEISKKYVDAKPDPME